MSGVGSCIVARGACNSKGPLVGFLNSLEAMEAADQIPVNLIFTIEGEEESGSSSLAAFYSENREQLRADVAFEPFWANYGTDVRIDQYCRWERRESSVWNSSVVVAIGVGLFTMLSIAAWLVGSHRPSGD